MTTMTVNGKTIVVPNGRNVSVINGVVTVDGVRYGEQEFGKDILEIKITEGTIGNLTTDCSVTCRDVTGNVQAGGSVTCDNVGGAVRAGGSVQCDDVNGDVQAGGSIQADAIYGRKR
jgi:hypothetical protein